jgi:hypothetical protein
VVISITRTAFRCYERTFDVPFCDKPVISWGDVLGQTIGSTIGEIVNKGVRSRIGNSRISINIHYCTSSVD